ncbi:MAG: hypothetical protein HZB80_02455 [Deltaproteobacteria bacterium]|nr:hypothetical protein [Deltaproteobacteria bacterium]
MPNSLGVFKIADKSADYKVFNIFITIHSSLFTVHSSYRLRQKGAAKAAAGDGMDKVE